MSILLDKIKSFFGFKTLEKIYQEQDEVLLKLTSIDSSIQREEFNLLMDSFISILNYYQEKLEEHSEKDIPNDIGISLNYKVFGVYLAQGRRSQFNNSHTFDNVNGLNNLIIHLKNQVSYNKTDINLNEVELNKNYRSYGKSIRDYIKVCQYSISLYSEVKEKKDYVFYYFRLKPLVYLLASQIIMYRDLLKVYK